VTARVAKSNRGLRAAWFESWYPKPDDGYSIIIEDDLELSPFWFTWLRKAWLKYGHREDLAGITLSVNIKFSFTLYRLKMQNMLLLI